MSPRLDQALNLEFPAFHFLGWGQQAQRFEIIIIHSSKIPLSFVHNLLASRFN
jgi:hypothetical protein